MAVTEGSITCRLCGVSIPLQLQRDQDSVAGEVVLMVLDTTPLIDHMRTCEAEGAPRPGPPAIVPMVPPHELSGRVARMLETHAFVSTGGSRACTMCGVKGAACLQGLRAKRGACCPACSDGNAHPAPGEAEGTCAVWATEHGAQD